MTPSEPPRRAALPTIPRDGGETLPRALLVDSAGHLTDLAAAVVADGEEALLPDELREHLAACPTCAGLLGDAALLSLATRTVLREAAPRTGIVPWRIIVPAIALAWAAALPSAAFSLTAGTSGVFTTLRVLARAARSTAFALGHAAEGALWEPIALFSTFLLVLAGVSLAVLASPRTLSQGK